MTKVEREYLRIEVNGLKSYFNLLREQDSRSLFLHFPEKRTIPAADMEGNDVSYKEFVLSSLQRLENKIDFLIRQLHREQFGKPYEFQADVSDIGGGGLNLSSKVSFPVGTLLDLCVFAEYGNSFSIYAIGKVQRVEKRPSKAEEVNYSIGVQFVEINEEDREALLRTIFKLDRKQKRR
jgi:hypothetical protein